MVGTDVVSGTEMTRYDMEIGSVIIPEYVHTMGLISDSNFPVTKQLIINNKTIDNVEI